MVKRSYTSKPGGEKKVDMEQRAKELEAKSKRKKSKGEAKRKEKAKENRKIATERLIKVELETRLKKKR